jgi:xylan 1,4-beta-xylosidase
MKYHNPVLPGFYPDPSVCRVGDDYYMVTSSFEYFPGVPIFHSRDLVHWRQIGHCLTRPSQLPLEKERCSGGIYAPTIRYHNGTFYMVTTNVWFEQWPARGGDLVIPVAKPRQPLHFYVHTQDPAGEWSDPIWTESHNIDPSLFFDDDGQVYFTCNGQDGIYQWLIDIKTGRRLSDIRHIWQGSGGSCAESPHLYKFFGRYYLLIAEGGTEYGHMATVARADTPWGPWESCPFNPILTHRNHQGDGISGTGHSDIFQAHDGNWWAVFLAFRPVDGMWHHLGRETFLAPVTWVDGWPVIGGEPGYPLLDRQHGKGTVRRIMEGPLPPPHPVPEPAVRDDFDAPQLALCWNFLRNPQAGIYSLSERPGHLRLHGSALTLNEADSLAFIGRRQQHAEFRATTRLEFDPLHTGDEAGLTVLMNNTHHYEIALTAAEDGRRSRGSDLIVRRRIGDLQTVVARVPGVKAPVRLRVEADCRTYTFSLACGGGAQEGSDFKILATGQCRYLSSEVAGGFTGVYLGLYATGNGKPCGASADFDWFDYEPLA